jgi:hypothetical protein
MTNECHAVHPLFYNWNSFANRLSQPLPVPQNPDRDFVLKVSALEIYNEVVKDLLASDSTPLRLLDDKEVMRLFSISLSKFWISSLSIHRGFYLEMWYLSRSSSIVLIRTNTLQRGTIVDKLKEEVVRDVEHLRQVIKICEGTHFAYTISIFFNWQT